MSKAMEKKLKEIEELLSRVIAPPFMKKALAQKIIELTYLTFEDLIDRLSVIYTIETVLGYLEMENIGEAEKHLKILQRAILKEVVGRKPK